MTSKKRRRHTPDQIIRKLAEGNKLLASAVGDGGGPHGVERRGGLAAARPGLVPRSLTHEGRRALGFYRHAVRVPGSVVKRSQFGYDQRAPKRCQLS